MPVLAQDVLKPRRWCRASRWRRALLLTGTLAVLGGSPMARAQFAVIDVASISHLVQEAQLLTQQLTLLRSQLTQAQTLYQSMSGSRGMQQLLSGVSPNYLPTSWSQLIGAMQGNSAAYPGLTQGVSAAISSNAVLSSTQLAGLPASQQGLLAATRQTAGLLQSLSEQALANSSSRFGTVQQLGSAIAATTDQKGILELQATLAAEQGLLENEQTKLQVLFQAAQSQNWMNAEHERELIIAGHGNFATRFEPSPR